MDKESAKKEISDIIFDALSQRKPINKKRDEEIKKQIIEILDKIDS